jgi:hypothetical protein
MGNPTIRESKITISGSEEQEKAIKPHDRLVLVS